VNLDTPIGPEELWRDANSCARCRSPTCAVPYDDRLAVRDHREVLLLAARTRSAGDAHSGRGANDRSGLRPREIVALLTSSWAT